MGRAVLILSEQLWPVSQNKFPFSSIICFVVSQLWYNDVKEESTTQSHHPGRFWVRIVEYFSIFDIWVDDIKAITGVPL